MAASTTAPPAINPLDFLQIDALLSDEERMIRDNVRAYVRGELLPQVAEWFEHGVLPPELAKGFGDLGVLGMHLEGYGCAGASATAYGLTCLELEAGDSGLRSFVSVQGSLAMFAIYKHGSEEQKLEWLPRMAAGEAIGCFGLTEPDAGSDPGSMRTVARRDVGQRAVGDPHLLAGDPPAAVDLHRARAHRRGIGAGVGLGQPEAAEGLAGAQPRQPLLLLLLRAPALDRAADEGGLDRDHRAGRRVAPTHLLDDQSVADVVEPAAAVLLGHRRAQVAHVAESLRELAIEASGSVVVAGAGDDLVVDEIARRLLDQALLVG